MISELQIPEKYINMTEISEIIEHPAFELMKSFRHHGDISCHYHTLRVTERSYLLAVSLKADIVTTIRGALLHDFYLYDWHEAAPPFHGYRHPFCAVREAEARFQLNPVERDIIKKHMFPLTPFPPVHLESRIVCFADKASAFEDYSGLIRRFVKSKISTAAAC